MSYEDRRLTCPDCNLGFVFSAEAQGLSNELGHGAPVRCRTCRQSLEHRRRFENGRNYRPDPFGLSPMTALPSALVSRN